MNELKKISKEEFFDEIAVPFISYPKQEAGSEIKRGWAYIWRVYPAPGSERSVLLAVTTSEFLLDESEATLLFFHKADENGKRLKERAECIYEGNPWKPMKMDDHTCCIVLEEKLKEMDEKDLKVFFKEQSILKVRENGEVENIYRIEWE